MVDLYSGPAIAAIVPSSVAQLTAKVRNFFNVMDLSCRGNPGGARVPVPVVTLTANATLLVRRDQRMHPTERPLLRGALLANVDAPERAGGQQLRGKTEQPHES